MNLTGILAILAAFFVIFFGISYDPNIGINLLALTYFINISSVMIVIFGVFSTVFIAFPLTQLKSAFASLKYVFGNKQVNLIEPLLEINDISKLARKNVLGIEDALPGIENTLLRGGLRMIIDRADRPFINRVLVTEIKKQFEALNNSINVYRFLASVSPAFGMIGTLIGLINLLQSLQDTAKVGPAMSVALVTTFYGALLANVVFTPVANKITAYRNHLNLLNSLVLDAVMLIEKTERPEHIEQALLGYFSDEERIKYDDYKYGNV